MLDLAAVGAALSSFRLFLMFFLFVVNTPTCPGEAPQEEM